ncbi:hypothetical protein L9F63_025019 [Diploptera punctata]|uniref:Uncharacterized protein n=1 Tax=Diploptera punctata TaxID=6984 RepID=A0AAD7ZCP0_DIPPU|nr:hypothetical protein L9F63_025019 [Diploptera punctata]
MRFAVLTIAALICIAYPVNVKSKATAAAAAAAARARFVAQLDTQGDLVVDAVVTLLKKYAEEHDLEPMAIPDMNQSFSVLNYDYDVEVMGINPTGQLVGTAKGLELTVDITADLETYTTTLGSLEVTTAADISIEIEGNGIADDIANAVSGIIEPFFEKDILEFVEGKMEATLADALVGFDIREIINV